MEMVRQEVGLGDAVGLAAAAAAVVVVVVVVVVVAEVDPQIRNE
jgi:hypothetical protein